MANQRVEYIDTAKGIGIVLVILGHLVTIGSPTYCVIYSFHMPFFFFVSGIFAKVNGIKFSKYILKHFKRLLVPYIIFFGIGMIFSILIRFWDYPSISSLINEFIYASPESIHVGQIWFLACLFNVTILFFLFYNLILKRCNLLLNILSIACIAWFAWFLLPYIRVKFNLVIPFKIESAFMALVFYSSGFLLKNYIINNNNNNNKGGNLLFLAIGLPIIIFLPYFLNGYTNLGAKVYGDLFYYLFFSYVGTITLLILSKYIKSKIKFFNFLTFLGKNSLFIFALHSIPQYIYILGCYHKFTIMK